MPTRLESPSMLDGCLRRLAPAIAETFVIIMLFLFFLSSFDMNSAVHGIKSVPPEIFAQDSFYIFKFLADGVRYQINAQNHLLYHFLLELGHGVWQRLFDPGNESTFRYLKLFTALAGLGFFIAMRILLRELGLALAQRLVLLFFAGVSVSIWFHFSAFETHCLAMPAIVVYLLCLVRLRDRYQRTWVDRVLLIGSLLVIGWTRIDLFRFAAVSTLLPLLPRARLWWRGLIVDLLIAAVVGIAGNAVISSLYFEISLGKATTKSLDRLDRPAVSKKVGKVENINPPNLLIIGRAVTLYSIVMPVEPRDPGRGFFEPPTYDLNVAGWSKVGERRFRSLGLFLQPAGNVFGSALSLLAATGVVLLLLTALGVSVGRIYSGDVLHLMLLAQAAAGWLMYTWFNPWEPFLWIVEYMPIWIVMIAEMLRSKSRLLWIGLAALAVLVALHNVHAFYLPFR